MIDGLFFDGRESAGHLARLSYSVDGMITVENGQALSLAFSSIKISPRIGNTARYIEFPDGEQFETRDNDAVDLMLRRLSSRPYIGVVHWLERNRSVVFALLITLVAAGWGFIQYGIPYFSREIAMMLPEATSAYLGKGTLKILDQHWVGPSKLSPARQADLAEEFDHLQQLAGRDDLHIVFRHGKAIGANALALPDGTILFTDELINIADNDREVQAVMLHEIGHIHYRHSLRSTIQQFSLAIAVLLVSGDVSTSSHIITAMPAMLVKAGYSQDMEAEADDFAYQFMRSHDMNPKYFSSMMEKLEASQDPGYKQCKKLAGDEKQACVHDLLEKIRDEQGVMNAGSHYFSTHPATRERIEKFRH